MAAHCHSSSASINHASPRLHKLTSHSYLLNPFTILTCLARPTTVFTTFFILLSISHACQAKTTTSAFALAIASYISLHPAFLLPPIALLTHDRLCLKSNNKPPEPSSASTSSDHLDDSFAKPNTKTATPDLRHHPTPLRSALSYLLPYLLTLLLLLTLSTLLLPSPTFLLSLYLTPLTLPDLTPNTGLWWYFFIEIFDPFRAFFLGVFWLHMLSYSLPFCLKFSRQPLAAVVLMLGITTIFEPYAHIGSAGAWLATLTLLGHDFERMSAAANSPTPACFDFANFVQSRRPTATLSPLLSLWSTAPCSARLFIICGCMLDLGMPISSMPLRWFGIWGCWCCLRIWFIRF